MAKFLISCLLFLALMAGGEHEQLHAETTVYHVQPGDTIWKVSQKYDITLPDLILSNKHIENPALIFPGDKLYVPVGALAEKVVELTNQARVQESVQPLKMDRELTLVAMVKARDMAAQGYFDHQSPMYGSPFVMLRNYKVDFQRAAENIAVSQTSPEQAVTAWLEHPGYRKNILNSRMTHIGVGYAEGKDGRSYWTQIFIQKPLLNVVDFS